MSKHYRLTKFYRRYETSFKSKEGAFAAVKAAALNGNSNVYIELWEMTNAEDGEMVCLMDGDGNELVLKNSSVSTYRAKLARV